VKTLGMVGFLGPESTVDYYRLLVAQYRERVPDSSPAAIVMSCIDVNRVLEQVAAGRLAELADDLVAATRQVAAAGADFAIISSNTPHIVFDDVALRSPIPLISIVGVACEAAKRRGLASVGLFGTRFTMQGEFFPTVFSRSGITVVAPRPGDLEYIHDKYTSELLHGRFLPGTREGLLACARRMKVEQGVGAIVLAGTELPLILRDAVVDGLPLLDTSRLHVDAAIAEMFA
jgi:aspartate racemase